MVSWEVRQRRTGSGDRSVKTGRQNVERTVGVDDLECACAAAKHALSRQLQQSFVGRQSEDRSGDICLADIGDFDDDDAGAENTHDRGNSRKRSREVRQFSGRDVIWQTAVRGCALR